MQCAAEKQFFHHGGHGAERQKLHEQLHAAAGQQGSGVLDPGQPQKSPAFLIDAVAAVSSLIVAGRAAVEQVRLDAAVDVQGGQRRKD